MSEQPESNLQTDQPDEPVNQSNETADDVPAGDATASPNKDETAASPVEETPVQTDNSEREIDGEQNASQDPNVQES